MDAFIVLVKLLCAHLCADFIFQTDSINKGKRKSGGKGTTCVENVLMCTESYIAWKEMTIIKDHVSEKPRRGGGGNSGGMVAHDLVNGCQATA